MANNLTCIMQIKTNSFTGKAESVSVCAHCQKEKGEGPFLASYLKLLGIPYGASHGICVEHYQKEMAKLKID